MKSEIVNILFFGTYLLIIGEVNHIIITRTLLKVCVDSIPNVLLHNAIIFPGLLTGEILFLANSKISSALTQHSQEKNWFRIAVQHQDAWSVAFRRLHSRANDKI